MNVQMHTPSERLALSRERLRVAISHNATQAPPPLAALLSGSSSLMDIVKDALPGTGDVMNALADWWKEASLRPLAQKHPIALVAGALVAGALLTWIRPWRWLFRPPLLTTLGPALLTSVLASGAVQAWILSMLEKKTAEPTDAEVPTSTSAQQPTDPPNGSSPNLRQ
ncbi:MAG: hypothetical protein H7Y28_11135 [Rhodoferax sp.]|nr:hypothetical protein [Rhodoferax sp.]